MPKTLYQELKEAGVEIDNHESDLYFPMTLDTVRILNKYTTALNNARAFRSNEDGKLWYDVPFAYDPFWDDIYEKTRLTIK